MKLLVFLLLLTNLFAFAQEKTTWNGKEYFVYPDEVERYEVEFNYNAYYYAPKRYKDILKTRHLFDPTILPYFGDLKDGEYVLYYKKEKSKDKHREIAAIFHIENNLPENKVVWLNYEEDTICTLSYKNGLKHGVQKSYTDLGILNSRIPFVDGIISGEVLYYFWNSTKVELIEHFKNGKREGEKIEYSFYDEYSHYSSSIYTQNKLISTDDYIDSNTCYNTTLFDTTTNKVKMSIKYDEGILTDSIIYDSKRTLPFYYSKDYVEHILDSLGEAKLSYKLRASNNRSHKSFYYPNGQLRYIIDQNTLKGYTKDLISYYQLYSCDLNSIYIDTIYNIDGSIKYIFPVNKTNDSTIVTTHQYTYINNKLKNKYTFTFHNNKQTEILHQIFNKRGKINEENYVFNPKFLFLKPEDSVCLLYSKINNKFSNKIIYSKKDTLIKNYSWDYYNSGQLQHYSTQSFNYSEKTNDSDIIQLLMIESYPNAKGTYYSKDKTFQINYTFDSLYFTHNNKIINEYLVFKKTKSKKRKNAPYWLGTEGELKYNIRKKQISAPITILRLFNPHIKGITTSFNTYPISGNWTTKGKDSIWKYKSDELPLEINYINDTIDGEVNIYKKIRKLDINLNQKYEDEQHEIASYNIIAYYRTDNKVFFKNSHKDYLAYISNYKKGNKQGVQKQFYPNNKLYQYEFIDSLGRVINDYTLTPTSDTIYHSKIVLDTTFSTRHDIYGISSIIISYGNTTKIKKYVNNRLLSSRTTKNNVPVGISLYYDSPGVLLSRINYNNSLSPNPIVFNLKTNTKHYTKGTNSHKNYYYHELFSNGKLRIEGYFQSNVYSIVQPLAFLDTCFIYYDNERLKQKAYYNVNDPSTSWIKEYYEDGSPKSEGTVTNYSFEKACEDDIYLPVFEFIPTNFWTRAGEQTLQNGTGTIFYKEEGTPKYEGKLKDGKKIGIWKYYDGNGNLNKFGSYVNGKKDGVWYAGDLKHIHYINECLDSSSPMYEERKKQLEQQINISVSIFKNGTEIVSDSFKRD